LYNVKRMGMPLEKQSLPHYDFWTELLPELVKEVVVGAPAPCAVPHLLTTALQGITYTILTARGLAVPPSRGSYDKL
jgi:hypothetical protein